MMPARVLCAARRLLLTWSRASAGAVWPVSSALAMVPIALCAPLMLLVTLWIPADAVASLRGVRVRDRVVRRQGEGSGVREGEGGLLGGLGGERLEGLLQAGEVADDAEAVDVALDVADLARCDLRDGG